MNSETKYSFVKNGRKYTISCRSLDQAMRTAAKHHEYKEAVPDRIASGGRVYTNSQILVYCHQHGYFK